MTSENEEKTWEFDDYDWVDRYDEAVVADSKLYARYDEVLATVAGLTMPSAGRRILDIGTGTGTLAALCAAGGAETVGLDPSDRMLAQARKKIGAETTATLHKAEDPFLSIPFPDAFFDAVISTYAYHHVPHRQKPDSVREMLRVLKPGGVWALGDLAFENAQSEAEALRRYAWLEDEYFARIDELRALFAQFGIDLAARQFTPVTWVLWAFKPKD